MTTINQHPTSYHSYADYRILRNYSMQPDFFAGLYATAGVEFFLAPKVSLGGEVSICGGYMIQQQKYTLSEGYNSALKEIEVKTDLVEPCTAEFNLSTTNMGGSLYVAFYF